MRVNRHQFVNWVLAAALAGVLVAIGIALAPDQPEALAPPETVNLPPVTTEPTPPRATCGEPVLETTHGYPLPDVYHQLVNDAHTAACRGDYTALTSLVIGDEYRLVIENMALNDPAGTKLAWLADALQRPATENQGGPVYCAPDLAKIAFARGTYEHPPSLGYLHLASAVDPVRC